MGVAQMKRVVAGVVLVVGLVAPRPVGAVDGKRLFVHRCGFCHTFRGLGHRQIGPDLTKIGARMTPEAIRRYIEGPRAVDATSRMPASRGLRPLELEAVVRLLSSERIASAAGGP